MSIITFLRSKKIIPSKDEMIKSEVKRFVKMISNQHYFATEMGNKELGEFTVLFNEQMKNTLQKRKEVLELELKNTIDAINKIH